MVDHLGEEIDHILEETWSWKSPLEFLGFKIDISYLGSGMADGYEEVEEEKRWKWSTKKSDFGIHFSNIYYFINVS